MEVPALAPGDERVALGYILPSGDGNEFTVKLETESGELVQAVPRITRDASQEVVEPKDVLFLAAGPGLSQLKRTGDKLDQPPGKDAGELLGDEVTVIVFGEPGLFEQQG